MAEGEPFEAEREHSWLWRQQSLGGEPFAVERERSLRWRQQLSYTQSAKISILRALVFDPQVCVVHHPTIHFNAGTRAKVMGLLREFVNERGLAHDSEEDAWSERRPRSCIFSTNHEAHVEVADLIWHVQHDGRIWRVAADSGLGLGDRERPGTVEV